MRRIKTIALGFGLPLRRRADSQDRIIQFAAVDPIVAPQVIESGTTSPSCSIIVVHGGPLRKSYLPDPDDSYWASRVSDSERNGDAPDGRSEMARRWMSRAFSVSPVRQYTSAKVLKNSGFAPPDISFAFVAAVNAAAVGRIVRWARGANRHAATPASLDAT